jgi:hypothetical protein
MLGTELNWRIEIQLDLSPLLAFVTVANTWEEQFRRKKSFILAHGFQGFCLWLAGPIVCRCIVRQTVMVEGHGGVSCSPHSD